MLSHVAIRVHAHACVLSRVWLFVTPWTVAFWLLCPWNLPGKNTGVDCHALPPGNLPDPGIEPGPLTSPALAGGFFPTWEAFS